MKKKKKNKRKDVPWSADFSLHHKSVPSHVIILENGSCVQSCLMHEHTMAESCRSQELKMVVWMDRI